jgi:pimeloyl-ACP methyl ester carboxylesterase
MMGRFADINGLKMYYEIHGQDRKGQVPLVLLHGALSATGTSFGLVLPELAKDHRVISIEQQAHGHTSDIDRPLTIELMAEDTLALLHKIGVEKADFFGYSMGAGIALHIAIRHPERVRKLVLAGGVTYRMDGMHPGMMEGMENLQPENLHGTPFYDEYMRIAPKPEDFPRLIQKVKELDSKNLHDWTAEDIRSIQAPTLLIIGDADIVRPEHVVEMFRLLGGGVIGDTVGLPKARLAILPGTTHITVAYRKDWLVSIVGEFLADDSIPGGG